MELGHGDAVGREVGRVQHQGQGEREGGARVPRDARAEQLEGARALDVARVGVLGERAVVSA